MTTLRSFALLRNYNIKHTTITLSEVPKTAVDVERLYGVPLKNILKTLMITNPNKSQFSLLTIPGDKRLDLARISIEIGMPNAKMSSPKEVEKILNGITVGGVTPILPPEILKNLHGIYLDAAILNYPEETEVSIGSGQAEIGIQLAVLELKELWQKLEGKYANLTDEHTRLPSFKPQC